MLHFNVFHLFQFNQNHPQIVIFYEKTIPHHREGEGGGGRGGGVDFKIYQKKGGSNFSHKKRGVGKLGEVVLKKRVSHIFILTNRF